MLNNFVDEKLRNFILTSNLNKEEIAFMIKNRSYLLTEALQELNLTRDDFTLIDWDELLKIDQKKNLLYNYYEEE